MGFTLLVIAGGFLVGAVSTARSAATVRRWYPTKANVVHCFRIGPFGKLPTPAPRRQIFVIRDDGTEELHVHPGVDDSTYFVEAVYTVDGVPYPADVFHDQPEDEALVIWVNPQNPRDYVPQLSGYGLSLLLSVVAAGLAVAALA